MLTTFKVFAVLFALTLTSCQSEDREIQQEENVVQKVTLDQLKKQLNSSNKVLPEIVQNQINDSKVNLEKYLKNDLQITEINVLGQITSQKGIEISQNLISQNDNYVAVGNLLEKESVKIGKIQNLNSGKDLQFAQTELKNLVAKEIPTNSSVLEISWNNKGEKFSTLCFYNESGIIWDNVLGGLIMIEERSNTEVSNNAHAKVSSKYYKEWWTASWLWGSKRGEIGYKITIYYTGSTVSNVDVTDWGNISLGSARSESKVTKKTGAYGQCKFALGLCTPTGSLSFNSTNFSVSFSGLGSNAIHNGTKSLYP